MSTDIVKAKKKVKEISFIFSCNPLTVGLVANNSIVVANVS